MTLEELKDWIKSAEYIECDEDNYDASSNRNKTHIYLKAGHYYRIYTMNGHYYEKYGEKGFKRGDFAEPEEVEYVEKQITVMEWRTKV